QQLCRRRVKREQLVQFYIEREITRRRRAPALNHSWLRHGVERRIYLDQVEWLPIPCEPLARGHFLRIPALDKTGIRPAGCADQNSPTHISTKSRCGERQMR